MVKLPRCIGMLASPMPVASSGASVAWRSTVLPPMVTVKPVVVVVRSIMARLSPCDNPASTMKLVPVHPRGFVGGQKQGHTRDMRGVQPELQRLLIEEFLVHLRRRPKLRLSLRHDGAGHDAVDADAGGAEFARQRLRHAVDRGLGGGVADHARASPASRRSSRTGSLTRPRGQPSAFATAWVRRTGGSGSAPGVRSNTPARRRTCRAGRPCRHC